MKIKVTMKDGFEKIVESELWTDELLRQFSKDKDCRGIICNKCTLSNFQNDNCADIEDIEKFEKIEEQPTPKPIDSSEEITKLKAEIAQLTWRANTFEKQSIEQFAEINEMKKRLNKQCLCDHLNIKNEKQER